MQSESAEELSFSNPHLLARWFSDHGLVGVYIQRVEDDWILKSYPDGIVGTWDESVYHIPSPERRWEVLHQAARTGARLFDIGRWENFLNPRWVFPTTCVSFAKKRGMGSTYSRYYRVVDTEKYRKG